MTRRNHRVDRLVSIMFSDNQHLLRLGEITAKVNFDAVGGKTVAKGDLEAIEADARRRMAELYPELNQSVQDVVGVLVASGIKGEEGHIMWLEDDEIARDERKLAEKKGAVK